MKITSFPTTQKAQDLFSKKKKISLNAVKKRKKERKRQNYFPTMTI